MALTYFEQESEHTEGKLNMASQAFESLIAEEGLLSKNKSDLVDELRTCEFRVAQMRAEVEHSIQLLKKKSNQVRLNLI